MALIVIIAVRYIPDSVLQTKELIMIGATSSITYAILDMIAPSVKVNSEIKRDLEHRRTSFKNSSYTRIDSYISPWNIHHPSGN